VDDESNVAFSKLFNAAFEIACRLAFFAVRDDMDAQDVAQVACLPLFKNWKARPQAFADADYLEGWVRKKVRGAASNFLRGKRRQLPRDTDYAETLKRAQAGWSEPAHAAHTRIVEQARAEALEKLSEQRRLCYVMKFTRRMKRGAIAAALGISVKTVDNHIAFASRALEEAERPFLEDMA
jgi:RNA polymerase sigma factor (sigma-70 family)